MNLFDYNRESLTQTEEECGALITTCENLNVLERKIKEKAPHNAI